MFTYIFKTNVSNKAEANELASSLQPFFYKVVIKVDVVENDWILSLSIEEPDENFCDETISTILNWFVFLDNKVEKQCAQKAA